MSTIATLSARARDRAGKGSARAARREGLVPAVIYGDKKDPFTIVVTLRDLEKLLKPGFFSHLIDIEVAGEKHRVLPRDLQQHPVTDRALHVDFLRVSATSELTVEVPVEFINIRVSARAPVPGGDILLQGRVGGPGSPLKGHRPAWFPEAGGMVDTPVYDRGLLGVGEHFEGPAIIEEEGSTLIVGPGGRFEVAATGNIVVTMPD